MIPALPRYDQNNYTIKIEKHDNRYLRVETDKTKMFQISPKN